VLDHPDAEVVLLGEETLLETEPPPPWLLHGHFLLFLGFVLGDEAFDGERGLLAEFAFFHWKHQEVLVVLDLEEKRSI
jgi:hypothetical protein